MSTTLKKARYYFEHEQYGPAVRACTELLKDVSFSETERRRELLSMRGIASVKLKIWADAQHDLLEALKIDVHDLADGDFYAALACTFEKDDKPACAVECYEVAASRGAIIDSEHVEDLRKQETKAEDRAVAEVFLKKWLLKDQRNQSTIAKHVWWREDQISNLLYLPKDDGESCLHILRGHSSYTPILRGRLGKGGGYLLIHAGKGCVIDPGHDFIHNFLKAGFGFGDIHAIVVTHAHDDHVTDLAAIGTILYRARLDHKVDLYLDTTTHAAFENHYLLGGGQVTLRKVLEAGEKEIEIFREGRQALMLDVFATSHKVPILDKAKRPPGLLFEDAVGVGFRLTFENGDSQYVLFPSDTGWNERIADQYKEVDDVDVAMLHISSIKPCEWNWLFPDAKEADYLYEKHLGLIGVVRFIDLVQPKVILLGERGAELDDVWDDLADIIRIACEHPEVYATDIGMKAALDGKNVVFNPGSR